MNRDDIENLLTGKFPQKHVRAALNHFSETVAKLQVGQFEPCIAKTGKFVEAVLKALWVHAGQTVPPGKEFKADKVITGLPNPPTPPAAPLDETVRLTIPRACRFVYDVASNRGGRHDPDEIDPNVMDASAVVPVCSWILAEMIRYAQKGAVDMAQAQEIVEALSARRYPLVEEVDGRVYFHHQKKSAHDVAILSLAYQHPKRMHESDLVEAIVRHKFKPANAREAVGRVRTLVDDDGQGNLRLLATGIRKAEEFMTKNGK